ncbi:MAG: rod shape-determining protein MreD [Candidatus Omnitrophica bacterium]|nr:rod shape-determining protein MreD [Candidatus Omnitrophota bacterium]
MHTIGRLQIYFILALALLLQVTVLRHIAIFGVRPDLLVMLAVFFGLFLGPGRGLETGIVAGALADLFALDFFGIHIFIFGLTGLLAGILGTKFSRDSARTRCLLVAVLTAFSMALHFFIASIFSGWIGLSFGGYFLGSVFPVCIYTALISIPIFFKLIEIYGLRGSEEYL